MALALETDRTAKLQQGSAVRHRCFYSFVAKAQSVFKSNAARSSCKTRRKVRPDQSANQLSVLGAAALSV